MPDGIHFTTVYYKTDSKGEFIGADDRKETLTWLELRNRIAEPKS
jgi:hypothetical protein